MVRRLVQTSEENMHKKEIFITIVCALYMAAFGYLIGYWCALNTAQKAIQEHASILKRIKEGG